ncbi:hypothetical protein BDQ17DRAFT_1434218 [Cyathus striatus]|nr:hypothetical protein BDQ17DRAFT_1434218 [Cyathus striatus]
MVSFSPEQIQAMSTALEHARTVNYLRVTTFTLLAFDYLLTFMLEVEFIWKAPWGIGKVLYIPTRFFPFFDMTISMAFQFLPYATAGRCKKLYLASTWIIMVGMASAEAVLTVRTWAVCGSRRWLAIVLSILFVSILSAICGVSAGFPSSLEFGLQDSLHPLLHGCFITGGKTNLIVIDWILLFVYDAVNTGLMIMPAYYSFKQGYSNLVLVIVRDGIVYYFYIFVVALANIVVISAMSRDYYPLIIELGRVLHSVLACRVVLHAREEARKTEIFSDVTTKT